MENLDEATLLQVTDLKTYFYTDDGVVKAVNGVDLTVRRGELLGVVGESGCGKSVTMLSVMRLIDQPGKIVSGSIVFDDFELQKLPASEMTKLRGNRIAMIFQHPQAALNPVLRAGDQIVEVLRLHLGLSKKEAWQRSVALLKLVNIPEAEKRMNAYPHELSGGMAQRVMIALALATDPELLIADEPTTALDVTIQAQILDLLRELRARIDMAIILITHDLGVVADIADRVAVMYAGQIVEETDVDTLYAQPLHPYTQGLMGSIPVLGQVREELDVIPGTVPNLIDLAPGCSFASRCRARIENNLAICTEVDPPLKGYGVDHKVRCWLYHNREEHNAPLAETAPSKVMVEGSDIEREL